ncbi:MAG: hypothetical protein GY845_20640 [Planctomycetes bacterium]|nr:hypothetical protein [Planctomycetota bacterium]
MTPDVKGFVKDLGYDYKQQGNELVLVDPGCDDSSGHLYVSLENAAFYCHKCSSKGGPDKLAKKLKPSLSEQEVNNALVKFGFRSRQKSQSKGKGWNRACLRNLTEKEIKLFCDLKRISPELFVKELNPKITKSGEVRIPGYKNNTDMCGYLRARLDGKDIRLKNGKDAKYVTIGKHGLIGWPHLDKYDRTQPIIVVESWKNCLAARAKGYQAVASTGGASCWKANWNSPFKDRDVIVCMDADNKGQEHALKIATHLHSIAKSVTIIQLHYEIKSKHGRDLHDYFEEDGYTKADFDKLIKGASNFVPTEEQKAAVKKGPYLMNDEGIHRKTDEGPKKLANFQAKITESLTLDDGVEQRREFKIESNLNGVKKETSVPAKDFAKMNWPLESLGPGYIISAGAGTKDQAREAIQIESGTPDEIIVHTHTGWGDYHDEQLFLTGNGAVGKDGFVAGCNVSLPGALCNFQLNPGQSDLQVKEAIQVSLNMLRCASHSVTMPIFCATYRGPLGNIDYSVNLVGQTGAGKTCAAALGQQHLGRLMTYTAPPANWSSTPNSLEIISFYAKDCILVIDDFKTSGGFRGNQELQAKGERIFRAAGNHSARQRLQSDSTLKDGKPPRALIMSTSEDLPQSESIRARQQIVEVGLHDINWPAMTDCQKEARAGLYEVSMFAYVKWLAPNIKTIQGNLDSELHELRVKVDTSHQSMHRRTPTIIASQYLGLRYFCEFAVSYGAISQGRASEILNMGWETLLLLGQKQIDIQRDSNPASKFILLLRSALTSGKAHLSDINGGEPHNPELWGWRKRQSGYGEYSTIDWLPCGDRIGWVNGEEILLEPPASFRLVKQLDSDNSLQITQRTLLKMLAQQGRIVPDSSRETNTVRRQIDETQRNVILLSGSLWEEGEIANVYGGVPDDTPLY